MISPALHIGHLLLRQRMLKNLQDIKETVNAYVAIQAPFLKRYVERAVTQALANEESYFDIHVVQGPENRGVKKDRKFYSVRIQVFRSRRV